ncbi:M17 family peptidase N-terminal domain-containing protein [Sphingobacterium lactis]|uniref:M17 family peptidase N-terminal domain-containing protein n=1 Tax=Sphingobacterium lactis TaxID=797291 RepID=UPI003F7F2E2E
MTTQEIKRINIGTYKGVEIELVTWDAGMAEVDLSCACMFTEEMGMDEPIGGLNHLNDALDGRLFSLRKHGLFKGSKSELLLLDSVKEAIPAQNLLIIGMGAPSDWTSEESAIAIEKAVHTAYHLQVESVAIAPGILDTGIKPKTDFSKEMLVALISSIDKQHKIFQMGLVQAPSIKKWVFDAGYQNFEEKGLNFQENFQQILDSEK